MLTPAHPPRSLSLAFATVCLPALAPQSIRVNGPLMRYPVFAERVREFQIAPSGASVAFLADPESGRPELFAAPLNRAGAWRRLSSPGSMSLGPLLVASGRVLYLQSSPPGGALELQAVPLDGSAPPVRLSPPLAAGGLVGSYALAAGRALVLADPLASGAFDLYSTPVDASSAPVALAGPLVAGGRVRDFRVTPNGLAVVFTADRITAGVIELWSAPSDGSSAPVRVSGALVAGGDVRDFEASANGLVVYTADAITDEEIELFAAPRDASSAPVRLNAPLVPGGDVAGLHSGTPFRLTPDGATVVYEADQASDGVVELWAAPTDASAAPRRIGSPLAPSGDVQSYQLSPDGSRVVYQANPVDPQVVELYSATVAGGPAVRLNAPFSPGLGSPLTFEIAHDGARVVYRTDQELDGVLGLWSVPIDGSQAPVRLDAPERAGADLPDFRLAGNRVLYRSDAVHGDQFELWSVPIAGGAAPLRLNGVLTLHGDVSALYAPTPGGARVVYVADATTDAAFTLWSAPVAGGAAPLELGLPLEPGPVTDYVDEFAWVGSERLLYGANDSLDARLARRGVFSSDIGALAQAGPVEVVHLGSGGGIAPSPDGARVAFSFRENSLDCSFDPSPCPITLRAALSDGSEDARALNQSSGYLRDLRFGASGAQLAFVGEYLLPGPPYALRSLQVVPYAGGATVLVSPPDRFDGSYALSLDGALLVYGEHDPQRAHLYSVPIDLSALPVELAPPLFDPSQVIAGYQLTPDGRSLVELVDAQVPGVFEFYLAALDGSAAPLLVGSPGAVDAGDFRISSDGAFLVYSRGLELWSLPLLPAGGGTPTRLSAAAGPFGGVTDFDLAPDATRAVYRAGVEAVVRYELFSVPLDGSLPPVRLHPPLGPNQGVEALGYRISADSSRVVFAANLDHPLVTELYAVPIAGGVAPINLCGDFVAGGELALGAGVRAAFQLSPDGAWVVYLADQLVDSQIELFSVPSDGRRAPRRLNRALVAGGDVRVPFAFSPDGAWVAYLADQDAEQQVELFVSAPDPAHFKNDRR